MADKPEDNKKMREGFEQMLSALNAFGDADGPMGELLKSLKAQFNAVLETLPPTDQVPAAQEASYSLRALYSCMAGMQSLFAHMNAQLAEMKTRHAALAATNAQADVKLTEAVAAAVQTRVKSGEFVPQATVLQLCSAAKDTGHKEGEDKVRAENARKDERAKVIVARKAALTTNSLPLPDTDDPLAGSEEEFKKVSELARARAGQMAKCGLALNSPLMGKCWASEPEYNTVIALVEQFRGRSSEPLAGAFGGGDKPGLGCV